MGDGWDMQVAGGIQIAGTGDVPIQESQEKEWSWEERGTGDFFSETQSLLRPPACHFRLDLPDVCRWTRGISGICVLCAVDVDLYNMTSSYKHEPRNMIITALDHHITILLVDRPDDLFYIPLEKGY